MDNDFLGYWPHEHAQEWVTTVTTYTFDPTTFKPSPCPGCGLSYLTMCAAASPHNFEACAAYKRGFADGVASVKEGK